MDKPDDSGEHLSASAEQAATATQPRVLAGTKARSQPADEHSRLIDLIRAARRVHPLNRLAITVGLMVVLVAGWIFLHHTTTQHELNAANVITDKVIASITSHDTAAIRSMGNKDFQTSFDKTDLKNQLNQFSSIYDGVKPAIDKRLIRNKGGNQYVVVVYRYDLLKIPFYISVDVTKPAGSRQWYVKGISTHHQSVLDDNSTTSQTQSI